MLLSKKQVEGNLRRTADKGLISLLNQQQLENLALKYFGIKDENGNFIAYQCPYSGKKVIDFKELVLEHIVPVKAGGGTIIFNCLPTSREVNGSNEKGINNLLNWWLNSKFWNEGAPERLEKIVNYIIEGIENYSNFDYIYENNNSSEDNNNYFESGDLYTTQEKKEKKEPIFKFEGYLLFLVDLINELKNYNVDILKYEIKINELKEKNIFKDVERYRLIQQSLKRIIKDKIEEEDRSELTILLYVDMIKLFNSLNNFTNEQIPDELLNRINNIEKILNNNDIGIDSYFFDINNLKEKDILYKNRNEIKEEEVEIFVDTIRLSNNDLFNRFIEYMNKSNKLPSYLDKDKKIQRLSRIRYGIQKITNEKFTIILSKEQLKTLHNSNNIKLKELYKNILFKSIINNIEIEYVDEEMKKKIIEYLDKKKEIISVDEDIELEKEYKNFIIIENKFNQLINYILTEKKLPSRKNSDYYVQSLYHYLKSIQRVRNNKFLNANLTEIQLRYLHDSNNIKLKELYKNILFKSIINNIEIEYVDEEMKNKILEYLKKKSTITKKENLKKLDEQYKEFIIIYDSEKTETKFNDFIEYVEKNNKLPNDRAEEKEVRTLGKFRFDIQRVVDMKFAYKLNKKQLKRLHDSNNKYLSEIYKNILYKSIINNIEIEYVDEEMKYKIVEYLNKKKETISINEEIDLEKKYIDFISIKNEDKKNTLFIEMIKYINNNDKIPSRNSDDQDIAKIGNFIYRIQQASDNHFVKKLTQEQLKYLHDSNNKYLREIYKNILYKSIINNIEIEYVDEEMKFKIVEYLKKKKEIISINEEIDLEKKYKDYIIIESQFNKLIEYILNNNRLPNRYDENDEVRKLAFFLGHIKTTKKSNNNIMFNKKINKMQLKYLHDSKISFLNDIYIKIMSKAYENNIEDYIRIDKEINSNTNIRRIA